MNPGLKLLVFTACREGRLENLKNILKTVDASMRHKLLSTKTNNTTPLIIACRHGHINIVEHIVKYCKVSIEDVGSVIFEGETIEGAPPLWCAAAAGHLSIVKFLIENGANVNSTTRTNSTPLRAACFDGHYDIVKFLVNQQADVELANRHGHTCLMIACYKRHYNIARFLIENNVDVNRKSVKGNTALHDCAESGSLNILILLLNHGARFDVDSFGMTPLFSAAVNGNTNIVEYLITLPLIPEREKIDALELLGATYIDKKRDSFGALKLWHRSLEWRYEKGICIYPKPHLPSPLSAYEKCSEVSTLSELEDIASDPDQMRMQALLMRERILGPAHPDTSYYIRYRGAYYADSGDLNRCLALWMYTLEQQQKLLEPMSPLTQSSFLSFAELFSFILLDNQVRWQGQSGLSFWDIFQVLCLGMKELKAGLEQLNKINMLEKDVNSFHRLCVILLQHVSFITKLSHKIILSEEQQLCMFLYHIVQMNPQGRNGWTLLHMACAKDTNAVGKFPLCQFPNYNVVQFLCRVGANVNYQDYDGNTPLHIAAMNHSFNKTEIITALLNSGAHPDIVNLDRKTFINYCKTKQGKETFNLVKYTTLKCLCASVIRMHNLTFHGCLPRNLEKFVLLH